MRRPSNRKDTVASKSRSDPHTEVQMTGLKLVCLCQMRLGVGVELPLSNLIRVWRNFL